MKLRLSLVLAVFAAALSAVVAVAAPSAQSATRAGSISTDINGTNAAGQAVVGTFTVTSFKKVNNTIEALGTFAGTVDGVATTDHGWAAVTSINGTPTGGASTAATAAAAGSCQILDLTLGPLHLDLLGLVVDLNQVHLTITAQQGSGNLLGNLLCAVAGLLDNNTGTGGGLSGLLQSITNLLNQILGHL
jgi:hypothetical protein